MSVKENYFGDALRNLYANIEARDMDKNYLPHSDTAYIASLLEAKFGKPFSFEEVERLIKELDLK